MKKKIINGILLSAMLFAGATSFVSCKDNVDDEITNVYVDLNSLKGQIDGVAGQIASLQSSVLSNTSEIQTLQSQLQELQNLYNQLEGRVNKNETDIADLQSRISALETAVQELQAQIKNAISGVIVQETNDPVLGTINTQAFKCYFLSSFVGENLSGAPEFPIADGSLEGYNVDPKGHDLAASEINVDPVWNSGEGAYLINGEGNAGTIYFTLNPIKADPSVLNLRLVNSIGEESVVKLSEVGPSSHIIGHAFGKHGNGLNGDGTPSDNYYLYEALATVPLDGIEKIHFDYTAFRFTNDNADPNGWDQNDLYNRIMKMVNNFADDHSLTGTIDFGEESWKLLQDIYNGIYEQREKLQYQALEVSWEGGENAVVSPYEITTVTINPLSYYTLYKMGEASWSVDAGPTPSVINKGQDVVFGTVKYDGSSILSRVKSYLKTIYAKTKNACNGNIPWALVQPIVVFDSNQGLQTLEEAVYAQDLKGEDPTTRVTFVNGDAPIALVLTSLTEEYLVPAYMKYVAVLQGGKVYQSRLMKGSEKVTTLDLPMGDSEIVYQVMDYNGYVVTKRYPITRVAK